jgi:ribonuclease HI
MKLYFDGSHTFNGSGFGFVIKRDAEVLIEGCEPLPSRNGKSATSNVAEYAGLLAGMFRATELLLPKEPLEILGDSQLVIRQVSGHYRVKAIHLIPFSDLAKKRVEALRNEGHHVELTWIRRELNTRLCRLEVWSCFRVTQLRQFPAAEQISTARSRLLWLVVHNRFLLRLIRQFRRQLAVLSGGREISHSSHL